MEERQPRSNIWNVRGIDSDRLIAVVANRSSVEELDAEEVVDAIVGLIAMGDSDSLRLTRALATSHNAEARTVAASLLTTLYRFDQPAAIEMLIELLSDADAGVKAMTEESLWLLEEAGFLRAEHLKLIQRGQPGMPPHSR